MKTCYQHGIFQNLMNWYKDSPEDLDEQEEENPKYRGYS